MRAIICSMMILAAAVGGALASEPVAAIKEWQVEVGGDRAHDLATKNGETTVLRPRFLHGDQALDLRSVWTVDLLARENGTTNIPYRIGGTTLDETNGTVQVILSSSNALPEGVYDYAIVVGAPTTVLARAVGVLEVGHSLAAETATNWAPRVRVLDCADVVYLNIGSSPWISSFNISDIEEQLNSLFDGSADVVVDSVSAGSVAATTFSGSAENMTNFPGYLARTTNMPSGVTTNIIYMGQDADPRIVRVDEHTWHVWMPLSSEGETATTNKLLWIVEGQTIGYVNTNGITMVKGSLQLHEEDLNCNVRALDGSRNAPAVTFQGSPLTGWYRKSIYGGSGWAFANVSNDVFTITPLGLYGAGTMVDSFYIQEAASRFQVAGAPGLTTNITYITGVLTNGSGAVTGTVSRTVTFTGGIVVQ